MNNINIDEVLDIAEYLSFLRLRLLADFYIPYLSWGIYTLVSGLLSTVGYFQAWVHLWIPAAFFSTLDPELKNLKPNLIVWVISGVIFYTLIFFLGFAGFFIGIAVASTLGFGILPFLLGSKRTRAGKSSYLINSIGATFFVVITAIIAQIFAYRMWGKPQLFAIHFAIMVGIFLGINAVFTRSRILFFWFLVLILVCAVAGYKGLSWFIPVLTLSIASISVGIYGFYLRNKIRWEVKS